MTSFASNIKSAFNRGADDKDLDRGNLVETVLIIAGLAVVAILVVGWIGTAIVNKGADVAGCIEGANTFAGSDTAAANCKKQTKSSTSSFTKDTSYKERFPATKP